MESPGEYFKRERAVRNISLQKVFEVTRVPLKYLTAIEADDIAALPSPAFVKGYIKAYCKYMGLDENDAVLRYEMFMREKSERSAETESRPSERTPAVPAKAVRMAAGAAAVLAVIIFVYFVSTRGKVGPPAPSQPAQSAQPPEAAQEIKVKAADAPKAGSAAKQPSGAVARPQDGARKDAQSAGAGVKHTLTLKASQTVWVRVRLDDGESFEATLKEGESVTWKADSEFSLLFGNAGGVNLTLDGVDIGAPGKAGQVLAIRLPADKAGQAAQVKKPAEKAPPAPAQAKPDGAGVVKTPEAGEKAQEEKPPSTSAPPGQAAE